MPGLTLIQLISEQTIQNLLPVLRLQPKRVVHLTTARTAARSAPIIEAAARTGLEVDLENVRLSDMPSIPETHRAVKRAIESARNEGATPVVNFTGGTKLMGIGAYAAALRAKIPSLYVDTQDACFVDGATSNEMAILMDDDWSFTSVHPTFDLDVIATANGVPRITPGKNWQPLLPLARHLFDNQAEEQTAHDAVHGEHGLFPKGREPRTPGAWIDILDEPFTLPANVARLGVETGLLRAGPSSTQAMLPDATRSEMIHLATHKVPDYHARYFKAVAPLQHTIAFLSGGWWELIVFEAAQQSGLFRDIRWSAHVGEGNGPDTEEDILGLDGVELLYINCKRSSTRNRLLPLLEEIRARAATMGGHFNRRFLAVLNPPAGKALSNLETQANRLGIRILTRHDINQIGVFSR